MTEEEAAAEFEAFVASLPAEYETSLMADNVSTAYVKARRKGWTAEQLTGDALNRLARGKGVGLLVTGFENLAQHSPARRDPKANMPPPVPGWMKSGPRIPAAWAAQRMALVRQVGEEHLPEEEAEAAMRDLIYTQESSVQAVSWST